MLNPSKLEELKKPFPASDVEWRIGRAGITNGKPWGLALAYITARAVMDRLDEVCGMDNWKAHYQFHPNGVICNLSIRIAGEWISKEDGAEQTEIEAFKGGISGSLKRAASSWGVGRYLYQLEEGFVRFVERGIEGAQSVKIEGQYYYWVPPTLPAWALPKVDGQAPKSSETKPEATRVNARLGLKAAGPAPTITPIPAVSITPQRDVQYKRMMELHQPFIEAFGGTMRGHLKDRYDKDEAASMTIEELKDMADFMDQMIQAKAQTPGQALPGLPPHPLDSFVIKPKLQSYQGKTFKQVGHEALEQAARETFQWFQSQGKQPRGQWAEFFDKAAEYLFGSTSHDGKQWMEQSPQTKQA